MKHGDLIENIDESGNNSGGVYMIFIDDGYKIIELDYEYNSYDSPNAQFYVISQFPIDHWNTSNMKANDKYEKIDKKYWSSKEGFSNMWHYEYPSPYFYVDDFEDLDLYIDSFLSTWRL